MLEDELKRSKNLIEHLERKIKLITEENKVYFIIISIWTNWNYNQNPLKPVKIKYLNMVIPPPPLSPPPAPPPYSLYNLTINLSYWV